MRENLKSVAAEREKECRETADFFDKRLRLFSKANWITVLVPSLLGVVAGSAIISDSKLEWFGIAVLLGAVLTAIHKGLDCDAHQAECRRLVQKYRGLETRYRTIRQVDKESAHEDFLDLEAALAAVRESEETSIESHVLGRTSVFTKPVILFSVLVGVFMLIGWIVFGLR